MSKKAIVYWSGTGNTEAMALAIAEGVKQVDKEVAVFEVSQISASDAALYDTLMLGCPSMGAEVLEETEFEPFFTELETKIEGKNIALFGSYGWGDGEWMRNWEERVQDAKANLIAGAGFIINETPDEAALAECCEFGKKAASI